VIGKAFGVNEMDTQEILHQAFERASAKLTAVDGDVSRLATPVRTFVLVHAAQGIIDNGGYRYFFGSNWPSQASYDDFVRAYEAIGCRSQAASIAKVAGTFPFSKPHLDEASRQGFMDARYDPVTNGIRGWDDDLCGDESVWQQLADFYLHNSEAFG